MSTSIVAVGWFTGVRSNAPKLGSTEATTRSVSEMKSAPILRRVSGTQVGKRVGWVRVCGAHPQDLGRHLQSEAHGNVHKVYCFYKKAPFQQNNPVPAGQCSVSLVPLRSPLEVLRRWHGWLCFTVLTQDSLIPWSELQGWMSIAGRVCGHGHSRVANDTWFYDKLAHTLSACRGSTH